MKYSYDHPRPAVTVDLVVVTRTKPRRVLLVRRKHEPFKGMWALPGGFVEMNESLESAARREMFEETGVQLGKIEQLGAFGDPDRDPRGRTISIAYLAEVDADRVRPQAADDADQVAWHVLSRPPKLAFDHRSILSCARRRLRNVSS